MIAVDASAMLAILLREDDGPVFLGRLARADSAVMSAVNYWETLVRAEVAYGAAGHTMVDDLLALFHVEVVGPDAAVARSAADAFRRFRGRSGGRLNLGDSFAYALAQHEGDGLLFKGRDFPKTDIKSAQD